MTVLTLSYEILGLLDLVQQFLYLLLLVVLELCELVQEVVDLPLHVAHGLHLEERRGLDENPDFLCSLFFCFTSLVWLAVKGAAEKTTAA